MVRSLLFSGKQQNRDQLANNHAPYDNERTALSHPGYSPRGKSPASTTPVTVVNSTVACSGLNGLFSLANWSVFLAAVVFAEL